jgi:hypothetical protein
VKSGTSVFYIINWWFCDSDDLLFTEAEQQACALEGLHESVHGNGPLQVLLSVDGGRRVNLIQERFLTVGPQARAFHVSRVPPHEISFSPAGYVAMLKPLRPGRHVVDLNVLGGPLDGLHIQSIVEVVPSRRP